MSIYTKTGDKGETSLFGGKRIKKYDPQIDASGSIDELSSFVGLAIVKINDKKDILFLTNIQKCLYLIMGSLCLPAGRQAGQGPDLSSLNNEIKRHEKYIDLVDKKLPRLTRFILPQGTEISAWFHVLRITCRKTERSVVYFINQSAVSPDSIGVSDQYSDILKYLNRLSDLFFIMARKYNIGKEIVT